MEIDVTKKIKKIIFLGYKGENNARTIDFIITSWITAYGANGTATVNYLAPGEDEAVAKTTTIATTSGVTTATWTIDDSCTENVGTGQFQLVYTVSGKIVKSQIYFCAIEDAVEITTS